MPPPPSEREIWRGPTWEIQIFYPAPGVLYTRVSGHADIQCARLAMNAFDRLAASTSDPIEVFHDWERVTGYDSEVRTEYTRWSRPHLHRLGGLHVLIRSRLVAMAISVYRAAVGAVITAHYDLREFDKARAEAILRRRRKSEPPPASGPVSSWGGPVSSRSGPVSSRGGPMSSRGGGGRQV